MTRTATVHRVTGETDVALTLGLDGVGAADVETGVGFLDHMLALVAKHAVVDLTVRAKGDVHVDDHHTVEDVGLTLGDALARCVGDKRGLARYGDALVPMDDALCQCAIDLSGRAAYVCKVNWPGGPLIGTFAVELVDEFFKSVAQAARMNLHLVVPHGGNNHHVAEAMFKSFARALRMATTRDDRQPGVPSTKGVL